MEAATATHFDDRDARAKTGRSLVRMKITNERTVNLPVGENTRVQLGTCEIEVWPYEVAAIKAMVETDVAGLEMAKQAFEVDIANDVLENTQAGKDSRLSAPDLIERVQAGDPLLKAAWDERAKLIGSSVEGNFRRMRGRDIKPLSKAEVVGQDIPSPYQQQEVAHARMLGQIMNASAGAPAARK